MRRRAVLVTRPEPGLSATLAEVRRLGWETIACPMLEIRTYAPIVVRDCVAIAITSANALASLEDWPRDQRIVAVGSNTADRARSMGFRRVEAADGDARSLAAYCRSHNLAGPSLLLACGEGYGLDLAEELNASRVSVYGVTKRALLTDAARDALLRHEVEAVVFYSGKTADAFMEALDGQDLESLSGVRALCLSEAIAARLTRKDWRAVEWPDPLERLGPY